jgi:hypothetical protein
LATLTAGERRLRRRSYCNDEIGELIDRGHHRFARAGTAALAAKRSSNAGVASAALGCAVGENQGRSGRATTSASALR